MNNAHFEEVTVYEMAKRIAFKGELRIATPLNAQAVSATTICALDMLDSAHRRETTDNPCPKDCPVCAFLRETGTRI